MQRWFIICAILYLFWVLYKWTQEKHDESIYDDYSNPKPPLYVYYNSSGIPIPMPVYFVIAACLSLLIGGLFNQVMNNLPAAVLLTAIMIYTSKQIVIIRSIRNSQRIDEDAPTFLTAFGNMMTTIGNPLKALDLSLQYAHKSYRKTLFVLQSRLENGQDPYIEVEKAKRFFRNRILRSFLDDMEEELRKGNALSVRLERLIDRAEDRKKNASERRIETFAGILVIYGGIVFEFLISVLVYVFRPEWFSVLVHHPIGKFSVIMIIAVTGFMVIAAQRLILLTEG